MTLIIQKYSQSNWPAIKGLVPFFVAGKNFTAITTTQTLSSHEWKFKKSFHSDILVLDPPVCDEVSKELAAEFLLREKFVDALWISNGSEHNKIKNKVESTIKSLAKELPTMDTIQMSIVEFLSGIQNQSYYHSYLADSGLIIEIMKI